MRIQEDDMDEKIRELKARARAAIADTASSLGELNDIRVKFLGKRERSRRFCAV